jgi:hypothetical protein
VFFLDQAANQAIYTNYAVKVRVRGDKSSAMRSTQESYERRLKAGGRESEMALHDNLSSLA